MATFSPTIISTIDYDSIRDLLGVTSDEVSDATIERVSFLQTIEAQVKKYFTNHAAIKTAAGDDYVLLKSGVCSLVAASLCPRLETFFNEGLIIGSMAAESRIDWHVKADDLIKFARRAFDNISTRTARTYRTLLYLAGPTRALTDDLNALDELDEWWEKLLPTIINWVEDESSTG